MNSEVHTADLPYLYAYDKWEPKVGAWEYIKPGRLAISKFPVGVKDNINTEDFETEMGSPIWKDFAPGNDARVVTKLKQAGATIVGKTRTAEFGVHSPPITRNPHCLSRSPGTSSSGSAVAVATGMVPAALGTQTAGSIIRPASWCGVYAMKPSFGLIPRTGILKTADTLDTVGFFTDTPDKLRTMLDICRVDGPDYPHTKDLKKPRQVKNIGVVRPYCQNEWPLYALEALDKWIYGLAQTFYLDDYGLDPTAFSRIHRILYHKSLAYYFKHEAQTGPVSDIFRDQVEEGRQIPIKTYKAALRFQELFANSMDLTLGNFDILITLSSGREAPTFDSERKAPKDTNLVWTLCGVPVINIPVFVSPDGLPFGVSIIPRKYHDYKLLDFLNGLVKAGLAPVGPNPQL